MYIYNMHTGYWLVCKFCYDHHSYQEWWSQLNKFFFGVKNLQTKCGGCQGFKGIMLPFLAKSCMSILTSGTSFRAIPKTRTPSRHFGSQLRAGIVPCELWARENDSVGTVAWILLDGVKHLNHLIDLSCFWSASIEWKGASMRCSYAYVYV